MVEWGHSQLGIVEWIPGHLDTVEWGDGQLGMVERDNCQLDIVEWGVMSS